MKEFEITLPRQLIVYITKYEYRGALDTSIPILKLIYMFLTTIVLDGLMLFIIAYSIFITIVFYVTVIGVSFFNLDQFIFSDILNLYHSLFHYSNSLIVVFLLFIVFIGNLFLIVIVSLKFLTELLPYLFYKVQKPISEFIYNKTYYIRIKTKDD